MNRDKLVMLQWSQSSEIMGGYSTPDSMLEIGRLMSDVYHEIISCRYTFAKSHLDDPVPVLMTMTIIIGHRHIDI